MQILMAADTRAVLGPDAARCQSRSLAWDRFVDPGAKKEERQALLESLLGKPPWGGKLASWQAFLQNGLRLQKPDILLGRLASRLIINASGGVLENAGLCLDRLSGVPFIPGAAVKGCARRWALATLREWTLNASVPDEIKALPEPDRPESPEAFLCQIARVFGWADTEWTVDPKEKSDFAWACSGKSGTLFPAAKSLLLAHFDQADGAPDAWDRQFASAAGNVCFLPAYPWELPQNRCDLQLDVLTCHHESYYRGVMDDASDTEEPIPVVFPTVAAGLTFAFAATCRDAQLARTARAWLKQALSVYGLGGKTSAGYGWFSFEPDPGESPAPPSPGEVVTRRENPLVTMWKGKTQTGNFRAFRPALAAIEDPAELGNVFLEIMDPKELAILPRKSTYWQSFLSHPDGKAIFRRLNLPLS